MAPGFASMGEEDSEGLIISKDSCAPKAPKSDSKIA